MDWLPTLFEHTEGLVELRALPNVRGEGRPHSLFTRDLDEVASFVRAFRRPRHGGLFRGAHPARAAREREQRLGVPGGLARQRCDAQGGAARDAPRLLHAAIPDRRQRPRAARLVAVHASRSTELRRPAGDRCASCAGSSPATGRCASSPASCACRAPRIRSTASRGRSRSCTRTAGATTMASSPSGRPGSGRWSAPDNPFLAAAESHGRRRAVARGHAARQDPRHPAARVAWPCSPPASPRMRSSPPCSRRRRAVAGPDWDMKREEATIRGMVQSGARRKWSSSPITGRRPTTAP